jgi:uncharacterized YigZ family protein
LKYCEKEISFEYEMKKSKFIAYLMPYKSFKPTIKRLKKQHPKARHFVYATRFLNEFNQIVENSSDDGEPKRTSATPSLNVLRGYEIINTSVVIVRYFGGTLLGTGGLVRAYTNSVNLCLKDANLIKFENLKEFTIEVLYQNLSKVEYQLLNLDIKVKQKLFLNDVILTLFTTFEKFKSLKLILNSQNKII